MDIKENDIIVLDDDNRYIVVKKANYQNKNYYYISNVESWENFKFLYEDGNELVEIEDDKTLEEIVNLMVGTIDKDVFLEEMKKRLQEKY